ncbi:MAG TPA: hypothetical protein DIV86_05320 [Alphaproteobacteria bacterium]|nr:hypothetical protein [Alphaproteobacteria bacterium]
MNNGMKTLAYKITVELLLLTTIVIVAVSFFTAYFLKDIVAEGGAYKMALVAVILVFSLCYVSYRVINSYIKPIKSLTSKLLDFKSDNSTDLSIKGVDTFEITNLYKALSLLKENYKNYQDKLKEEVWARTMELEDYKNHLEQMVEDQIKDIRLAKFEAERANKAKTEFLANMSHEFRTPMHAIISFSSLGLEKGEDIKPEKAVKYFQSINSSGKRLMNLLNDLLDLSKLESGVMSLKIEKADITSITKQVINEIMSLVGNKKIKITSKISTDDTGMLMDHARITQVIMNLFSNALKFSPEAGEVAYSISKYEEAGKEYIKFNISDQGIGIPDNELENIFDKFVQSSKTSTGAGGTGLGLSICKIIIENHGGHIWAENNAGGGASFNFIIPKQFNN